MSTSPVRPVSRFPQLPPLLRWSALLGVFLLSVLTLLRLATFLSSHHGTMPWEQAGAAFWLGFRFDLRIVTAALFVLLTLGAIPPLHPFKSLSAKRGWFGLLGVYSAALVVFYTADFIHYRYLSQRLNASALGFLGDAQISASMAWQTYPLIRIALGMLAGVAVLSIGTIWLHRRASLISSDRKPGRGTLIAAFTGAILLCLFGMFGRVGQYPLRWSDAFNLRDDASAHLALNPVQSFLSSLRFRGSSYDAARVRAHYDRMREYLGVDAGGPPGDLTFERHIAGRAGAGATAAPRPNVVLVICESFSGYKSSMWGNSLDPTPFFARLCRDGVFFDNCFTPHYGTARGVWATITGIPDVEPTKTASRNPALVDQHTIINDFAGYEKLYFLGGSSSWANIRGLLTNNIDGLRLYEEDSYQSPRVDVWGISDKSLFLEANEILGAQTAPFFAIIQTAGNHRPYTIPEEDRGEFSTIELSTDALKRAGFESNAEFNAFRYSDFAIQKFIEAARQKPYFDHTIFVFIGDHGIAGDAGTMFPRAWTDQNLTSYHVPLLFYAPKLLPARRIHSVASMVDLLPTVAGAAGIDYRNTTMGRDLLRQQALDGGRSNVAFVVDQHSRSIGVIHGAYYASHQRGGGREDFVWADFSAPPPESPEEAALHADYKALADAFHETARFLLFNNKKRSASVAGSHAAPVSTTAATSPHASRR